MSDYANAQASGNDVNPRDLGTGRNPAPFRLGAGYYTLFASGTFDTASLAFQIAPSRTGPWFDLHVFTAPGFKLFGDTLLGSCEARWAVRAVTANTKINAAVTGGS